MSVLRITGDTSLIVRSDSIVSRSQARLSFRINGSGLIIDASANTDAVSNIPLEAYASLLPFSDVHIGPDAELHIHGSVPMGSVLHGARLVIHLLDNARVFLPRSRFCDLLTVQANSNTARLLGSPGFNTQVFYLDLRQATRCEISFLHVIRRLQMPDRRDRELRLNLMLEHEAELSGDIGQGSGLTRAPPPRQFSLQIFAPMPMGNSDALRAMLEQAVLRGIQAGLEQAIGNAPTILQLDTAPVGDADHPYPEMRYALLLGEYVDRICTLAQLRGGSVLHQDADVAAIMRDQHPQLCTRLSQEQITRAIDAQHGKLSQLYVVPPLVLAPISAFEHQTCVICHEDPAAFNVCAQCRNARYCEVCFSRQVILSGAKCAMCRAALEQSVEWL